MTVSIVPARGTQLSIDLTPALGVITISGALDSAGADTVEECVVLATGSPDRRIVIDLTGVSSLGERTIRRLEGVVSASRRRGAVIDIDASPGCVAHHALGMVSFVLRPRSAGGSTAPRPAVPARHLHLVGATPSGQV